MSSRVYNTDPAPHVLPPAARQAELAAYMAEAPGFDLSRANEYDPAETWPQQALHVAALIRPGFSGNLTVTPYRTIERDKLSDDLLLQGCGHFAMVYENAANISDADPGNRQYPDFISLSLDPAHTEIIALQNGGRLLVQKKTTEARGGAGSRYPETRRRHGVASVERLVTDDQLRPLMARLAIGVGLEGPDAESFTAQPFRKIERFVASRSKLSASKKRPWWSFNTRHKA